MPDEPREDLEPRVSAGADRDVSEVRAELRAHLRAITALGEVQRETRMELRQTRTELKAEIDGLRTEMRTGFATMGVGMAQIVELLERPEG